MDRLAGQRVALYARFSSDQQRDSSIDDQVRRCREHVERQGGAIDPALVFADYAVSGASLARPGFESMMRAVADRQVDVIVTEDVSRITRDFADGAALFKRLQFIGVPLVGVADGVDTGAKHGKLSFAVKNLVADLYRDDLRDKTIRGQQGRQLARKATGNLPYGFRSVPEVDARGRTTGHGIEIHPEQAAIIRRIFDLYLAGRSLTAIAKELAADGIAPPREGTAHRAKGWGPSTIRAMLYNARYTGTWRFMEREWVRVPGSNRRQPRKRPEADVMVDQRPELAIIPPEVWKATQDRLRAVRSTYTRTVDGQPKGRSLSGRRNAYLLSGLLHCASCGAPLIIMGGSVTYYRCPDHVRRGTCSNDLYVREQVIKERLLAAVRSALMSPSGVAYARKKIAEVLGALARKANAEIDERRARLARTENRIAGLVTFIADGDQSAAVRSALVDLEAQAKTERAAIEAIEKRASRPIHLPSPAEVEAQVFALESRLARDPLAAREEIRRLFKDAKVVMHPQDDRSYIARGELLPLALAPTPGKGNAPTGGTDGAFHSLAVVAGAGFDGWTDRVVVPVEVVTPPVHRRRAG